jgi:hypothetical protein
VNVKFFNNRLFFGVFTVVVLVVLFFVFFSVVRAQVPGALMSGRVPVSDVGEHKGNDGYPVVNGGLAAQVQYHIGVLHNIAQNDNVVEVQGKITQVHNDVSGGVALAHNDLEIQEHIVALDRTIAVQEVVAYVHNDTEVNLGDGV